MPGSSIDCERVYRSYAGGYKVWSFAGRLLQMGLFRYFSKEASNERKRASAQKRLSNMYYQSVERMGAAQEMAELAQQNDAQALIILLQRFEHMNPSTTIDRDEKDYVVELLAGIGSFAVEGTKDYVRKTVEAIFWPMRFLQKALSEEEFTDFLAEVLAATSEDYTRDPKKKLNLVQLAGEHHNAAVKKEVIRFVNDHDESVRFHAIDVALRLDIDGTREALAARWANPSEESGRIWTQIATAFIERQWSVGEHAAALSSRLPFGASISPNGVVTR